MPFNKYSVQHIVLTAGFVRSCTSVFLNAPATHELFSIQGSIHSVLCSWPVETAVLWSMLLPTAPCLAQDGFKTLSSTTGGKEMMHGPIHGVFLYSCLFLRHPKKYPETNLFLTN